MARLHLEGLVPILWGTRTLKEGFEVLVAVVLGVWTVDGREFSKSVGLGRLPVGLAVAFCLRSFAI